MVVPARPDATAWVSPRAQADTQAAAEQDAADDEGFSVESPAYAAVRWLAYACMLAVIGTVVLARLLVPRVTKRRAELGQHVQRGAARVLGIASAVFAIAVALRLIAQIAALRGGDDTVSVNVWGLATQTMWGWSWLIELAGVVMALAAVVPRPRAGHARWRLATAAVTVLALSFALGGHAAAVGHLRGLAVVSDGLHVIAAGAWLGTLLSVVLVAIPAALSEPPDQRGPAAADFVNAFSPVALWCAAIVALTGVVAAWMHLGTLSALWTSGYGRTLLVKLALVATVLALGAVNWRVLRPSLGTESGAARIRRSAMLELAAGAAVLAATAVLVATSPPTDMDMGSAPPPHAVPLRGVGVGAMPAASSPSMGISMRASVPRSDDT